MYYPPLGFYFEVRFENIKTVDLDARFQSVSGLSAEMITETRTEGGNFRDLILPLKVQFPDLVLKRGILAPKTFGSEFSPNDLQQWCLHVITNLRGSGTTISIHLKKTKEVNLMSWIVKGAMPKKWSISDFNAQENQVLIETMEFSYNSFSIL